MPIKHLQHIPDLEKDFRTNLINSLHGYKPALLLGTKHSNGKANLAIFSNIIHLGADPALIGILMRPEPENRHSYPNILREKHFSLNTITSVMQPEAHQTSARYGEGISEAQELGMAIEWRDNLPYVEASPVQIHLSLCDDIIIPANQTRLICAQIEEIFLDESLLCTDGFVDHARARTLCSSGLDAYLEPTGLTRYSYAKTNKRPEIIG